MTNYNERLDDLLTELRSGTINFDAEVKQLIKQFVADEMMGLLDRIESNKESLFWWTGGEYDKTTGVDMRAIAAERTKLAEWKEESV